MSGSAAGGGADALLVFEHLGEFALDDELVLADASYLGPQFEGVGGGGSGPQRQLQLVIEVCSGTWHALLGQGADGAPAVLLLCHDDELARSDVLEQAEAMGVLQIDGGRLVAGHVGLRDDAALLTELPRLPAHDFPGIVLEAGAAIDGVERGYYPVFVGLERPRAVVFVPLGQG